MDSICRYSGVPKTLTVHSWHNKQSKAGLERTFNYYTLHCTQLSRDATLPPVAVVRIAQHWRDFPGFPVGAS